MVDKKIIKMSIWMMSGLVLCPLITFSQLYSTKINVEENPYISDITIECLNENIRLTVHLENKELNVTYTLTHNTPVFTDDPETNATGVFVIPNLQMIQSATIDISHGFCTDTRQITFGCSTVLPVNIINIYAQLNNNTTADIIWKISNEVNVRHYVVEKSATGSTFDPIGIVPVTTEVSVIKTYNYIDNSLFSGTNYYRIKIEDLDGTIYYTKIVSVFSKTGQVASFKIYPNPTSDNLFVEYINANATYLDLKIYNQLGQLMKSITYSDGNFPKIIELSVFDLSAGTYIIKATDQHGKENISKFFKLI